jgi:hypothetical protein
MARSLGSLGTPHEQVDLTFDYEQKSMGAIARYLKGLVDDDDWDTFWRTAKANRQTLPDLLMVGERIIEAVSNGVPTQPSSDSAGGRPITTSKSKAASQPRRGRRTEADVAQQALSLVPEGRSDLKEFIVQAQEVRQTSQDDTGATTTASRMGLVG